MKSNASGLRAKDASDQIWDHSAANQESAISRSAQDSSEKLIQTGRSRRKARDWLSQWDHAYRIQLPDMHCARRGRRL